MTQFLDDSLAGIIFGENNFLAKSPDLGRTNLTQSPKSFSFQKL